MAILHLLKKPFLALAGHKRIFLLLLILEAVFFIILGIFLFGYSIDLGNSMEEFTALVNSQQWMVQEPTRENLESLNIPSADIEAFSSQTKKMVSLTLLLLLKSGILFALFRSLSFALSLHLLQPLKPKQLMMHFLKYLAICSSFLGIILLLITSIAKTLTNHITNGASLSLGFYLPAIGIAFLMLLYPVIMGISPSTRLSRLPQDALRMALKNFLPIFGMYALSVFLVSLPIALLFFLLERLGLFGIILGMLALISIVYCRIALMGFFLTLAETEKGLGAQRNVSTSTISKKQNTAKNQKKPLAFGFGR